MKWLPVLLTLLLALRASGAPNVLIIFVDDLGWPDGGTAWSQRLASLGLGVPAATDLRTPNLDQLVNQGLRFTSGYVTSPVCSPSRAGLMTGRYHQRFGYEMNPGPRLEYDPVFGLPVTESTIADRMKAQGYATAWIGKSHLGALAPYHPVQRGFDEFFGFLEGHHSYCPCDYPFPVAPWAMPVPPWEMTPAQLQQSGLTNRELWDPIQRATAPLTAANQPLVVEEQDYLTTAFGREIVSFIDRHTADHPEQPFFIYAPFNAVHEPQETTQHLLDETASLFPAGEIGSTRHKLAAMLYGLDEAVGAILTKLRSYSRGNGRTMEHETLIVFSSDNGAPPPDRDDVNGSVNTPLRDYKSSLYEGGIRVPFVIQWLDEFTPRDIHAPVSTLDILPTCVAAAGGTIPAAWQLDGVNLLPWLRGQAPGPHDVLYWRVETGRADEMPPGPRALRQGRWKMVKPGWGNNWELYDLLTANGLRETENVADAHPEKMQELIPLYESWEATLPRPRWDFNDPDYVTPTFVLEDVRTGPVAASVIAPEFLGDQVAWQDESGNLWRSALDLSSGFPAGAPIEVTTGLAAPSLQNEGVQWGVSSAGASLFYTKPGGTPPRLQLWRDATQLTTHLTLDNIGPRVSQNAALPAVGIIFSRIIEGASWVMTTSDAAPASAVSLPSQGGVPHNGRWIPGTAELVYVRSGFPVQLARFNPATGGDAILTDDGGSKTDAFAFFAPEFGGELCYACVVDRTGIAIYRDLHRDGGLFDRVATLTIPASESARFIFDMKPVAGLRGFNGVSWFSCVACQNSDTAGPGTCHVWLLGLGTAPAYRHPMPQPATGRNDLCTEWKPYALKVSDPLAGGIAREPETVIGTDELFCFYSRQNGAGPVQLRRARTGLKQPDAAPSGFAGLAFTRDATFTPGQNDPAGQRIGGTETTALVAHAGKLFAATGSRGDSTALHPQTFAGVQILVKDSAATPWRLDTSGALTDLFGDHLTADVLTELTFTRSGSTPVTPVKHLVAGLRDPGTGPGSHLASARLREASNDWRHSTVAITPLAADPVHVMSFAVHRDGAAEYVFAGLSNGEIYRGIYDPNDPERLVWEATADLAQNPAAKLGPVTGLVEANGVLFAACGIRQDTAAGAVAGGLYARNDLNDSWVKVYEWPVPLPVYDTPESQRTMNSLTAVPDPRGCPHEVLLAARSWPGVVELIDPARADLVNIGPLAPVSAELDVRDFFARLWQDDSVRAESVTVGYTPFTPAIDPVTGERVDLLGVWFSSRPGTWFLIRHLDGTWEAADIPGAGLRAARCFAVSPFAADRGAVLYAGGYDAGAEAAHDTAWVYRGAWNDWPALTISPNAGNYELSWPFTTLDWELEGSSDLTTWLPWPEKPARSLTGTTLEVDAEDRGFFRLRHP